jgi:uncharacterized membrane protein (DUF106 family)
VQPSPIIRFAYNLNSEISKQDYEVSQAKFGRLIVFAPFLIIIFIFLINTFAGVALAPKILEPKKSPNLIFCRQFSNIEAKLWFHFLSSRFLSHFCKGRDILGNAYNRPREGMKRSVVL